MDAIMTVKNLKKRYGALEAVKGVDILVKKGSLLAFVGPNGAGKSTTIHILTTFLKADEGEVEICGYKLGSEDYKIKKEIGIVFQDSVLDAQLSVEENLKTRGRIYNLTNEALDEAINYAMEITDIKDISKRKYGQLSGGQRRRVDIARALIHHPTILFLDEPTTGLDPQTRLLVWDTIYKLQKEHGMTVFLTTHYMEEVSKADYVYIIDSGKIVASGTPNELKDQYSSDTLQIKAFDKKGFQHVLTLDKVNFYTQADIIIIPIEDTWQAMPLIEKYKTHIASFQIINGTMDDAFVKITGKDLRDHLWYSH